MQANSKRGASDSSSTASHSAPPVSPDTKGEKSRSKTFEIPSISLPKGGGALKSIDEKFSVNPATGTASFSIPLPISPGRNGFQPALSLQYNSGSGNSILGIGWSMELPAIQRKTDRKLPRYVDEEASDIFMFSGAEDLVPLLMQDEVTLEWKAQATTMGNYTISAYRPRTEGLFARIEKIQVAGDRSFYWKVTTKDNVVTFFGKTKECRLADPADDTRIFKWLPEISFDDKGNCMQYVYKQEDLVNVPGRLHEQNRLNGLSPFTNRYLKRIRYANRQAFYPAYVNNPVDFDAIYNTTMPDTIQFMMELVMDYGEHNGNAYAEAGTWPARHDACSEYKAGFDIRTYRLCRRVMMFHLFAELDATPTLVRSLDMQYQSSLALSPQKAEVTYLETLTSTHYRRNGGVYTQKSMPPLRFEYQLLNWNKTVKTVEADELVHAPNGLSGNYQWMDFYSEGVSGIVTDQADGWYYKSNLGKWPGDETGGPRFSRAKKIAPRPSFNGLGNGTLQLQDLEADGTKQIVINTDYAKGFFELTDQEDWLPFRHFRNMPNINFGDPNLKMADLNGDGQPDLLISEENVFTWYAADGKNGYHPAEHTHKPFDEERGPNIIFAGDKESIYMADMSGDGLQDIVRIRNGEIVYWPNLGYGRFGAKISMSDAPVFDTPDQYRPAYLQLCDVSGTGATDIVYMGKNGFRAWLNCCGNTWSEPCVIDPFPTTEQPNRVAVVDLLGTGTGCIVWSSPQLKNAAQPMRYIDLMGGIKPHIMRRYINGFGKENIVTYKSSAQYYLEDKRKGKPWITKLPFPVQCVSRVEHWDRVTNTCFVNEYSYHHGYYDAVEREFRGFARVEQTDTETYDKWVKTGASNITDERLHQPPVKTVTWFHTGAFIRRDRILNALRQEYFHNTAFNEYHLPDVIVHTDLLARSLDTEEWREALRACKGMMLRQEVYGLDGSPVQHIPYTVAERNCKIRILQPREPNRYAVFITHESEALHYHYERNPADPRIAHTLNTKIDGKGNVLESASVVYKRAVADATLPGLVQQEQNKLHIIYSVNSYTKDVATASAWRIRAQAESIQYELTGPDKVPGQYFATEEIAALFAGAAPLDYHIAPGGGNQKRRIEHIRTLYMRNDLAGPLQLGTQNSLGLVYEGYSLAFTQALINTVYDRGGTILVTDTEMNAGHYLKNILYKPASPVPATRGLFPAEDADDDWWIPNGTVGYAADAAGFFYMPVRFIDPFGHTTIIRYENNYRFYIEETEDALGSIIRLTAYDYRLLQPAALRDINNNITEVKYDILGVVAGVSLRGKGAEGDDFTGFKADLTDLEIQSFLNDPEASGSALLQRAGSRFVYDMHRYINSGGTQPVVVATITREIHANAPGGGASPLQFAFEYSDGHAQLAMKKIQAEPGIAKKLIFIAGKYEVVEVNTSPKLRWIGNGRTILNNKGNTVKQYEPYFSDNPGYENARELVETGVSSVLFYDAAGRNYLTEIPNGTFTKTVYTAWQQQQFDANDTVVGSAWYNSRIGGAMGVFEQQAAEKAAVHHNTPATIHLDTLGRSFYTILHNKYRDKDNPLLLIDKKLHQYTEYDIEKNERRMIDARNMERRRLGQPFTYVTTFYYDMLGHRIREKGMDSGERWMLKDCTEKDLFGWNSKNQQFISNYDTLNRPVSHEVILPPDILLGLPQRRILYDRTIYGTNAPADLLLNLNGKPFKQYDGSGELTYNRYNFKGKSLSATQRFTSDYKSIPDWTIIGAVAMQPGPGFTNTTDYDALSRPVQKLLADGSTTRTAYNRTNLLTGVYARIRGAAERPFVTGIEYDAKGQRSRIQYGNNSVTNYGHDPLTYRLSRLHTVRNSDGRAMQDIHYTYDPGGNITHTQDDAWQRLYFRNAPVDPHNDFEYDALYQLTRATGREHTSMNRPMNESDDFRMQLPLPSDETAMQTWRQLYEYDEAGNMLAMIHRGASGGWTRSFDYHTSSNQLRSITTGAVVQNFTYDVDGNMENLPHLNGMSWDFENQLERIDKGGGGMVYYSYDAEGNRVRKVWEKPGNIVEDRIYMGNTEFYTRSQGGITNLQRETLHIMDEHKRIAMVETRTSGLDAAPVQLIKYEYANHLGTASLEADENAAIISYEEYYPFGSTAYQSGRSSAEAALKRYRYTGKERDEESGLYYYGARYYAPWLCRWTAADPSGIRDGWNIYQYVHNNPVKNVDPDGRWTWGQVAGIAAAVAVGVVVTAATGGLGAPAVIGAIAGGVAGGVTSELVEAAVDRRPTSVGRVVTAGVIGGVTGGLLHGAGAAVGGALATGVGRAAVARAASSAAGRAVTRTFTQAASRLAIPAATRPAATVAVRAAGVAIRGARGLAAVTRRSERAGEAVRGLFTSTPSRTAIARTTAQAGLAQAEAEALSVGTGGNARAALAGELNGGSFVRSTRSGPGGPASLQSITMGPRVGAPVPPPRAPIPAPDPRLEAFAAPNPFGPSAANRALDAEYKLFAQTLLETDAAAGARSTGTLYLFADRTMCGSCTVNWLNLRAALPGVDVIRGLPIPGMGGAGSGATTLLAPRPPERPGAR